jgi:hypothetical protein
VRPSLGDTSLERLRLAIEALPFEEARVLVADFLDADLEAVVRPFDDAFEDARGADLLDEPRLAADEERLLEAEADRPPEDDDLDDADFLLPPELALRLPEAALLLEERPEDDARPEDWLRDFFIDVWFYNDD